MTDWQAIIQRAAYTRFSKTGSLEPFLLARKDLRALAQQVAPDLFVARAAIDAGALAIRVVVPVPTIGATVPVDEWKPAG